MPIPAYSEFFLPILKMMGDKRERHKSEIFDCLDKEFQFSEVDKSQLLKSGISSLSNRMSWGLSYLKQAGLLESEKRGYYKITEAGQKLFEQNPSAIDVELLREYAPKDSRFFYPKNIKETDSEEDQNKDLDSSQTPLELIVKNHQLLKDNLARELLEEIKNKKPRFFESLVVNLLLALGYGGSLTEAGEVKGGSGDGGIDGIIREDKLGLDIIYLQAKRYDDDNSVGAQSIREFVGALSEKHASKGVFITTSYYTKSAREYVKQIPQKVILIDGDQLANYMIDNNVGVFTKESFNVKEIDINYFEENE